eukprot:118796-Pyramimonas_sp.AAC.1
MDTHVVSSAASRRGRRVQRCTTTAAPRIEYVTWNVVFLRNIMVVAWCTWCTPPRARSRGTAAPRI